MNTKTPLIIGNWKMNPQSVGVAERLFKDVQKDTARIRGVDIAVAPPFVYLPALVKAGKGKKIAFYAQDVFFENLGARTGEVSPLMLKSINVMHTIIGHSERRALGETDEMVNQKVLAALKEGLGVVICVGEKERDQSGAYLAHVEKQLQAALTGVPKNKLAQVVLAYEPIWAIGTGNTATTEDVHEMKIFVQKVVSDLFGRGALSKIRILYGGSVNKGNAEALFVEGNVDGFLIGGASLRASEFAAIAKTAAQ